MAVKNFIPTAARNWLARHISVSPAPTLPVATAKDRPTNSADSTFGNPAGPFRGTYPTGSLKSYRLPKPKARKESIRNSRFCRAQLGIVKALFEQTGRYALGNGLIPTSLCEDPQWRPVADAYFHSVASSKKFDIRGDCDFNQMQKMVLPDVMCDGDAGAIPTRSRLGDPRLQFFPTESIGDHPGPSIYDAYGKWDEGIMRSEEGERIAYRILTDHKPGSRGQTKPYVDYAAEGFFHIGRVDRINGNRPMPWLYHGDQSAINILDLNQLEMAATRLNSYFAAAVKTRTGEIPMGLGNLMNDAEAGLDEAPEEGADPVSHEASQIAKAEQRIIDLYGQAVLLPLEDGQELQFFRHERNAMSVVEFINYFIADMAVGFGVPGQFIWSLTGMAGPYTRLILQQADWFFTDVAEMLVGDFCQPVWEGVIEDGMNRRLIPPPKAGTNWRAVQWQGPGAMSIDRGRDGKLYLDMVKNGMLRRSSWHEMTGKSGMTECFANIDELATLIEYCRTKGVPPGFYFGREFGASALGAAITGQNPSVPQIPVEDLAEAVVNSLMQQGLVMHSGRR